MNHFHFPAPRWRHVLAALLAVTTAGCASLAPKPAAPPLPVADAWPTDAAPGTEAGRAATQVDWRDYFTDPALQRLIDTALANNRDLRVAALRVQEARAGYRIQRADQWPTLGLGAVGVRAGTPEALRLSSDSVLGVDSVYVGASSWELDLWGRVRSLKDAALEDYLAADAARRGVQVALIEQVADGYLGLRELDERSELARQTVASREESYRIFALRHEVGAISELDLTQVKILLTQAQSLSAQLEQERAMQAHALAQLIGVSGPFERTGSIGEDRAVFAELRVGLPSEVLLQRPDIVAAEHQLQAAQANIGAARAAFFPRISLTANLGSASTSLDGLFDSGSRSWTFLPMISLPIFDAGRLRANLDLSEVRRDIAVANYEKSIQSAFRDVADALAARTWLAEQVRIQRVSLDTQSERARLAKLRYDNGTASYLEVLDAQRDLLSVQQQWVHTRRTLLSSQVALYAALGGGAQAAATALPSRP